LKIEFFNAEVIACGKKGIQTGMDSPASFVT